MKAPADAPIPQSVRVELAHAAVAVLGQRLGVDLLIVKGPGMDPLAAYSGRASSDVDVLIRPSQVGEFLDGAQGHGWFARDRFETGSPFGHSVTMFHPTWGDLDVHRRIPGIEVPAADAYDVFWATRIQSDLAGQPCPHPDPVAQAVILVLHAARSEGSRRAAMDVEHAWTNAPDEQRRAIRALVDRLDAQVAWAAATGGLDAFRHRPTYRLWLVASQGGGRLQEWRARVAAEPTWRGKAAVTLRAPWSTPITSRCCSAAGRRAARWPTSSSTGSGAPRSR